MNTIHSVSVTHAILAVCLAPAPASAAGSEPVTIHNFVRAESDQMYEPRQEVLDGSWTFPRIQPVN